MGDLVEISSQPAPRSVGLVTKVRSGSSGEQHVVAGRIWVCHDDGQIAWWHESEVTLLQPVEEPR